MTYDSDFYQLEDAVAAESAAVALPMLFDRYPQIQSVVDIGCGTGAWAWTAQQHHKIAVGVDHDVPSELRRPITYINCDLTNGYPCSGFDLAICLEVAEHLPETSSDALVNGLARARLVLFSAATPGQPGVGHVNCQPHTYWHDRFLTHGFQWEHLGPTLPDTVADFYRRNMYIYERTQ